ncbi:hypothetical protein N0V95_004516 [Ascochyta clinopodiicola]|nr:hypothetical protein N0V95_004516 [Ascochyta clinopodiicola]
MAPIPNEDSPLLHSERISQFVALPPAALASPLPALCASILSPLLLSYFAPAHGVVLAYEDVALSSTPPASSTPAASQSTTGNETVMLRHIDEYASPFLWVTATFLIWRPRRGNFISGRVTQQSKTHLTLSYLNLFPISILATHLPQGWTFVAKEAAAGKGREEGGVWTDQDGEEVRGDLRVRLLDFDARSDGKAKGKGVRLEGSLVSEGEEKRREKEEGKGKAKAKRGILKAQGGREVLVDVE